MPDTTPLTCPSSPRYPGDLEGCGSSRLVGPDDEGLYDCLECGLFFTAEAASARTEEGTPNAP